jgi:hypothetical protein
MWLGGSVDQFYVDVAGLFRDQAINITDLRSFVRRIGCFVHFAVITQHVYRLALALRINMIPDLLQSITYVIPFIFPITRYYTNPKYKDVLCKMPLAAKVFNHTKRLTLLASTALSFQMCPSNFHSNDVMSFAPKISLFVLKL